MAHVRIAEVNIDMLLSDGTYVAKLLNINGGNELSQIEEWYAADNIPAALRGVADQIEAAALHEFRADRKRPGT